MSWELEGFVTPYSVQGNLKWNTACKCKDCLMNIGPRAIQFLITSKPIIKQILRKLAWFKGSVHLEENTTLFRLEINLLKTCLFNALFQYGSDH